MKVQNYILRTENFTTKIQGMKYYITITASKLEFRDAFLKVVCFV